MSSWAWKEGEPAKCFRFWRWCGMSAAQMSAQIHRQHQELHYTTIMCDPGAGGIELYRNIRNPNQDDGKVKFGVTPIISEEDEQMPGLGDPVWAFFKRGDWKIFGRQREPRTPGAIPHNYPGESHLPNQLHRLMKLAHQKKEVAFPPEWPGWKENCPGGFANSDQRRNWLNEHRDGLSPEDRSHAEIDLALLQLVEVERQNDEEGKPLLDKYNNYSFTSKRKKDSAYALCYGYFAVWCYQEILRQTVGTQNQGESELVFSASEVF